MSETPQWNRRDFLKVLGLSVAGGLAGCSWSHSEDQARDDFKRRRKEQERVEENSALPAETDETESRRDRPRKDAGRVADDPLERKPPKVPLSEQTRGLFGLQPGLDGFAGMNAEQIAKRLHQWRVNAVWVERKTAEKAELVEALHAWQIRVYLSIGVFVGWHERNRPITAEGTPLQLYVPGHWYQGTCPNQTEDLNRKLREIQAMAQTTEIDGVWLDAVRYPGFWETPKPKLAMTCFCPVCLGKFQAWAHVEIPADLLSTRDKAEWILGRHEDAWTRFRMDCVTDVVGRCAKVLKEARPTAQLGLFTVPWRRRETRGDEKNAIERIIAQDYPRLAAHADVISPMTYHRMCGEPVPWIADVTEWVAQETGKPVWPVIQAHGEPRCPWNPYQLSTAEFQQALLTARSGESSGAIVFTLESVFADKRVTALTENFCRT